MKHLIIILLFLSTSVFAQKKNFTMEEATIGLRGNLAPKNLRQLQWVKGTEAYSQLVKNEGDKDDFLLVTQVPAMKMDTATSLERLNTLLKSQSLTILKKFPSITWVNSTTFHFQNDGQNIEVDFKKNSAKKTLSYDVNNENLEFSSNRDLAVFTMNNNLYYSNASTTTKEITNDGDSGIVNGKTVHRSEFGINKGVFIAPDANLIAYYRMDESMVEQYPVYDFTKVPVTVKYVRYPMAGRVSHQVKLAIYDIKNAKTVYVNAKGAADSYLTNVTWSPDSKYIYIVHVNRAQNQLQLNKYNSITGEFVSTILEEKNDKFIEPEHGLTFMPNSNDGFVWFSKTSGYNHLYMFDPKAKVLKQITKGKWDVNELLGVSDNGKEIYFTSGKESPLDKYAFQVIIETGEVKKLTTQVGIHSVLLNSTKKYLIDIHQNTDIPRKIKIVSIDGVFKKEILNAVDPLKEYATAKVQLMTLKADDGTTLYGKLMVPDNFDPEKKYPVVVYLYGGSHNQLIKNSWPASGNLWYDYLTQNGFVVWSMDNRGSSNRGLAFEQATFRKFGTVELADQMVGVNYLKSLSYIDTSKMGIHGWSFGGFMATSMMLRNPGVFKSAVAGGPVIDWNMYEVMYTERYMDTPEENPEGYKSSNLLTKSKNLKGNLLLVHGTSDDVVIWQQSVNFIKKCVDEGVQVDYFMYPGHEHNVMGKDRVHLMQKVTDYFFRTLK